jgi:uncharacterized protein
MVQFGAYNRLRVLRIVDFGLFLDDGKDGILLPKRFAPENAQVGDSINVFVYHDSEDRPIATTQKPLGVVGDIVKLKVVSTTPQGAFLDWGLMKDLFVPRNQQLQPMRVGGEYLVKIYQDEFTDRIAASEKIDGFLQNKNLSIKEGDEVNLTVLRRTNIGYLVIINNRHTGVLHHNEIYRNIQAGDTFKGFIKKIYEPDSQHEDYRIDVAAGQKGYQRVEGEGDKILRLLQENGGYLPYGDKTAPDTIYDIFGMSKKTFKMTLGKLYREKKIDLVDGGMKITESE